MNARIDDLLEQVLSLGPEDRSAVAMALIGSFEAGDEGSVSDAWREELRQRREPVRAGTTKATPWSEACARIAGW